MLKVGYYQFEPIFGEVESNLSKVLSALGRIEADLVVLPELAFTGYYFKDRSELLSLAEDVARSPVVDGLTRLCRRQGFHMVTGFAERYRDKVFNSALLIGPQGLIHTYRKLHLFNTEKECFDPGDIPLATVVNRPC